MRRIAESLALLFGSLIFCLVLGEAGARIYYAALQGGSASFEDRLKRSDQTSLTEVGHTTNLGGLIRPSAYPDIVYELKPNITGVFLGRRFSFNSFGMRDREFSLEKPPTVKRIVGLGDSILFGWGVEQDDSYLKVVERELNHSSGPRWEVLNFGVPGYNTAMEAAVLEHRASLFRPDIIVLHFVRNDFTVPLFMQEIEDPWDLHRSFFRRFVTERLSGTAAGKALLSSAHVSPSRNKKVLNRYQYMLGPRGFLHAMQLIRNVAALNGAEVIVVTGSVKGKVGRFLSRTCTQLGFRLATVDDEVEKHFAESERPLTKQEQSELISVSPKDSHPNALGHFLYAQALMKELNSIGVTAAK